MTTEGGASAKAHRIRYGEIEEGKDRMTLALLTDAPCKAIDYEMKTALVQRPVQVELADHETLSVTVRFMPREYGEVIDFFRQIL